MAALAVIGIIYGALVSMVQPDLKKLVAYSSVSHLGFVVLGIFALTEEGMQGAVIQMVNHGLSTGALFLLVGMVYDRRHTRMIRDFGGLARVMPVFASFFMIVALSSAGLPGLNGFVGEFLILLGSFGSDALATPWFAILGATGVIFAAVYLLWSYQRVFFGTVENPENQKLKDLSVREWAVLVPVVLFVVWIGFYPSTFLGKSAAASKHLLEQVQASRRGAGGEVGEASASLRESLPLTVVQPVPARPDVPGNVERRVHSGAGNAVPDTSRTTKQPVLVSRSGMHIAPVSQARALKSLTPR
jgi:NADH-quinone oxidoreductase subunit M